MAQLAVIVMCPSERPPPVPVRRLAPPPQNGERHKRPPASRRKEFRPLFWYENWREANTYLTSSCPVTIFWQVCRTFHPRAGCVQETPHVLGDGKCPARFPESNRVTT